MATTRAYFIPGWGYINEVKGKAYFIPGWGYVNETVVTTTTTVDQWLPQFPAQLNYPLKTNKEYTTHALGVFNLETIKLDKWLPQTPYARKEYLSGQIVKGIQTVDIGVFTKETITIDKWSPIFRTDPARYVLSNTGSIPFLYPVVIIPVTTSFTQYFHKRRGQPGTIMRGSHGPGGSQVGQ